MRLSRRFSTLPRDEIAPKIEFSAKNTGKFRIAVRLFHANVASLSQIVVLAAGAFPERSGTSRPAVSTTEVPRGPHPTARWFSHTWKAVCPAPAKWIRRWS